MPAWFAICDKRSLQWLYSISVYCTGLLHFETSRKRSRICLGISWALKARSTANALKITMPFTSLCTIRRWTWRALQNGLELSSADRSNLVQIWIAFQSNSYEKGESGCGSRLVELCGKSHIAGQWRIRIIY